MKTIISLLVLVNIIVFISGCSDVSDSENPELPKVINVSVAEGDIISYNSPITVTFDKVMSSAEINIYESSCGQFALGQTKLDGNTATWSWGTYTPPGFDWGFILPYAGNCKLTVTGIDENGQNLEEFTPLNFRTSAPT